jgi:mannose-6-phosphate isomerase
VLPIVLEPNMPDTFYRGAGRIERLRGGAPSGCEGRPEDWLASTTARFGRGTDGMTRLADGSLLARAIAADPVGWACPSTKRWPAWTGGAARRSG